jgi:hypothetical protein
MLRTVTQKRNIHSIRRLMVNMAAGACLGLVMRFIGGFTIAPTLLALSFGAVVLYKIYREEK